MSSAKTLNICNVNGHLGNQLRYFEFISNTMEKKIQDSTILGTSTQTVMHLRMANFYIFRMKSVTCNSSSGAHTFQPCQIPMHKLYRRKIALNCENRIHKYLFENYFFHFKLTTEKCRVIGSRTGKGGSNRTILSA